MDDGRSLKVKLLDMAFGIWRIAGEIWRGGEGLQRLERLKETSRGVEMIFLNLENEEISLAMWVMRLC